VFADHARRAAGAGVRHPDRRLAVRLRRSDRLRRAGGIHHRSQAAQAAHARRLARRARCRRISCITPRTTCAICATCINSWRKNSKRSGASTGSREECAALTDPGLYRNDPRARPGGACEQGHVACRSRRRWCCANWRPGANSRRSSSNLPRGWVVADTALVETALVAPHESLEELGRIAGIGGSPRRANGARRFCRPSTAVRRPEARVTVGDSRNVSTAASRRLYEQLQARVRAIAEQMKISATLLAPRRELLKLIAGDG
jgi:hypothetical protein